jgi:hypothetical protein
MRRFHGSTCGLLLAVFAIIPGFGGDNPPLRGPGDLKEGVAGDVVIDGHVKDQFGNR